jgi:adenosylmethionine-8-amino-7-oxononanoate aminotransferase
VGLELVENKATKDPFPRQQQINKRIKQQAFANGLMCYPMGGTIDGSNGDHVLLAPPYIISEAELQKVVDILETSFAQVFA